MLTPEEWETKKLPFWWLKAKHPGWTSVTRDMIGKWIDAHCSGWCYFDGSETYIFQLGGDFLTFKMWIAEDPFSHDGGSFNSPEDQAEVGEATT